MAGELYLRLRLENSGGSPKYEPASGTLSIRLDAQDYLLRFTRFLNPSPPPSTDEALAKDWYDTFLDFICECREWRNSMGIADSQYSKIILQLSPDERSIVNSVPLAIDQVCYYSLSDKQERDMEFVQAVEKQIICSKSLRSWELDSELDPDSDKVVIVSYADDDHKSQVAREAVSIIRRLAGGFLENGQQVACHITHPDDAKELLRSHACLTGEPSVIPPPRRNERQQELKKARVIWLYNVFKDGVIEILTDIPPDSKLLLYLIGPGTEQGLQIRDEYLGPSLTADDFLDPELEWRLRNIRLLYLSFSYSSEQPTALIGARRGFLYRLLRHSPRIAALVCFRWTLQREVLGTISRVFHRDYLRDTVLLSDISRSLFKTREYVYDLWKRGDINYFCAWAAPMLITQRSTVTPSDERPSPHPGVEHDADRAGTDADPGRRLREDLWNSLELGPT